MSKDAADNRSGLWLGASLVTALLVSICCIGPVILGTVGLSALGLSTMFEPFRPLLLGLSFLLLGGGFYMAYFRTPVCESDATCSQPAKKLRRVNRAVLWLATAVVLVVAFFPTYVGSLFAGNPETERAADGTGASVVTLHIDGMTCGACAVSVQQVLADIPGVHNATVSYEQRMATIELDTDAPASATTLQQAIEEAGYTTLTD